MKNEQSEIAPQQTTEKGIFWGENRGVGEWVVLNEMWPNANNTGTLGLCTVAMEIDGHGCIVQTVVSGVECCSVSQCFVPGVRVEEVRTGISDGGNITGRKLVPIKYSNVVMD